MCVIFVVGDLDTITFYPIASTILKWLILKNCEVVAIPVPFSLAQQWVGIYKHCWVSMATSSTIIS
jgi:hypothetical protein